MSTGSTPEDTPRTPGTGSTSDAERASGGRAGAAGSAPVAADRPVVDGAATSADELAAEVEELSDERRQDVDQLRAEIGETVTELAGRLNLPARVRARTRTTVDAARGQVGQVQAMAVDRSAPAVRALRERPAAVAVGVVTVLLVVLAWRWNGARRCPGRPAGTQA